MDCKVYGITREVLMRDIEDVDDIVRRPYAPPI